MRNEELSGKMCLMIILKVTKKQGFTSSLENTVLEKPHWGSNGLFRVNHLSTNPTSDSRRIA